MRSVLLSLGFLLATTSIVAQDHGDYDFTPNQNRADQLFEREYYGRALTIYKGLEKKDKENAHLKRQIAECYRRTGDMKMALDYYQKASFDEAGSEYYFYYAEVLAQNGKYGEAKRWYEQYLAIKSDAVAAERLADLNELEPLYADSSFYNIVNLAFNSKQKDFSPFYDVDGVVFVSSRRRPLLDDFKHRYHRDESLYLSLYEANDPQNQSEEQVAFFFKKQLGTAFHEGPGIIFDEGRKLFFTRNNVKKGHVVLKGEDGYTRLKLFYSERPKTDGYWSDPLELPFNSAEFSTGHPAILDNGRVLVFASDRPGGYGGPDLYRSVKEGENWSEPENLGATINTAGKEMFPFISQDGSTLYFASEGHGGLGGLDIYRSTITNNQFSSPINMGYPINSPRDDFGLIYNPEKSEGYFSSDREGGKGSDDIYYFKFTKPPFVKLEGVIVDEDSREPIENAVITLSNNNQNINSKLSGPGGRFDFELEWDREYLVEGTKATYSRDSAVRNTFGSATLIDDVLLEIKKELIIISGVVSDIDTKIPLDSSKVIVTNETTGEKFGFITAEDGFYQFYGLPNMKYAFKTKKHTYFTELGDVNTMGIRSGEIRKDFPLEPIVLGKPIRLGNIYFDLDKADITTRAAVELDKFIATLNDNPSIIVELGSHTDSRGSDAYNLRLSQRRATSSGEYVISQGIMERRIASRGYGETALTNECDDGVRCSEEKHEVNRRSEFKVLGFLPDLETEEEKSLLWLDPNQLSDELLAEGGNSKIKLVNDGKNVGDYAIKGRVLDEDTGQPIQGVQVFLKSVGLNSVFETASSKDGSYAMSALPAGEYELLGVLEGYLESGIKVTLGDAGELEEYEIELKRK